MNNKNYEIKKSHLDIIKKAILGTGWELDVREHDTYGYVEIRDGADIIANAITGDNHARKNNEFYYEIAYESQDILYQIMEGLAYWTAVQRASTKSDSKK